MALEWNLCPLGRPRHKPAREDDGTPWWLTSRKLLHARLCEVVATLFQKHQLWQDHCQRKRQEAEKREASLSMRLKIPNRVEEAQFTPLLLCWSTLHA